MIKNGQVNIVALMVLFVKKLRTKKEQRKTITSDEVTVTLITTTIIQESTNVISEIGSAEVFQRRIQMFKIDGRKRL